MCLYVRIYTYLRPELTGTLFAPPKPYSVNSGIFVSNRPTVFQLMVIKMSSLTKVITGVPQGSVLGVLLLHIYFLPLGV